jgi:malonyl CoA-acyl carrier protein transacylase
MLQWISLSGNEQRVINRLIDELESSRAKIRPVLETNQGRQAVISA